MKKAFTLVELLVVVGILGILIGVLVSAFGGSTESARAVKCASNLRNLAMAAIAAEYPPAKSTQYFKTDLSRGGTGGAFHVSRGWLSYLDQGTRYPLEEKQDFQECSFASPNAEEKWYALTNGAIWRAISGRRESYLCPTFVRECSRVGVNDPGWSYQMSAHFVWRTDSDRLADTFSARADRLLLFAEIPALALKQSEAKKSGVNSLPPVNLTGGNGTDECDGYLEYKSAGGNESIGFNHRRANQIVGHVAFADGHVETIIAPKSGNFVELTDWLCTGHDISYHDGAYEALQDTELSD